MTLAGVLMHGFGQRYDLPISLSLYLYAAAGVVVISFVLVVLFAGDQVGAKAVAYPRRRVGWLSAAGASRWPRLIGGTIGVLGLLAILITGFAGSPVAIYNPAEYLTWIYFWAATVILSGLVGNIWYLVNPWSAIYDVVAGILPRRSATRLPGVGVWPAVVAYLAFACLELTSGLASTPRMIAWAAAVYSVYTVAGMIVFGRDTWLGSCEAFTVLFDVIGRFSPLEAERSEDGRITAVFIRPWGVGLLKPIASGWDRVVFVILMLSTLAFDGILATPTWTDFTIALKPLWDPLGAYGTFFIRTVGILLLTITFLLVFVAFMEAVIFLGRRHVDLNVTLTAFALTLVPIALVYNAAHNYSYVMVQSQNLLPLLSDPLAKGWRLFPSLIGFRPSYALAQASTVWYAQVVLIVLGHVVAVYLSHLRAGERFRTAQRALLSQYPMLLLMVMYTMTSLWILAQPITREA